MRKFNRICVYCGASNRINISYKKLAFSLGALLGSRSIALVYGGGNVGLMKEVADGALSVGGTVLGVIPRKLRDLELAHPDISELFVTESMHERKMLMAQLADAFIALPGGWGTLEELAEAATWTQLNYHEKPVGLLNHNEYFDHLLKWLSHAQQEGFISPIFSDLLMTDQDPNSLLQKLSTVELARLEQSLS